VYKRQSTSGSVARRVQHVRKDGTLYNAVLRLVTIRNDHNDILGYEIYVRRV
jgi:hypothetical protein